MKRASHVVTLASALLLASNAAAQTEPKNKRKSSAPPVTVKQSERSKLPVANTKQETKPEISSDTMLGIESMQAPIQREQETLLLQLIETTPDDAKDEKADYFFRLGELYAKGQRYNRLMGTKKLIEADGAANPNDKKKLQGEADKFKAAAKDNMIKAVKTYKGLTENAKFQNYKNMDKALFFYGFTLQDGGYQKESREQFDRLLKNYPKSKYVPQAHFAFAEYHFNKNELDDAKARYEKVLEFKDTTLWIYAKYKIGWVQLNQNDHKGALATFDQVVAKTKGDDKQKQLFRAAKKDLVRAYAEIGDVKKGYQYFQRVDKADAFGMYATLGDFMFNAGKYDRAIFVFRDLMDKAPKDKRVCEWQYSVARSMIVAGNNNQKVEEVDVLGKLYSAAKKSKSLPEPEMKQCREDAAGMASELATQFHSEGSKTKNFELVKTGASMYKTYVENFPEEPDAPMMRYWRAEALWLIAENEKNARIQTEGWEEAAMAFTDVVKEKKVDNKTQTIAADAMITGWRNALNVDPRAMAAQANTETNPKKCKSQPIPDRENKMMEAFDIYQGFIQDKKEVPGIMFQKARVYSRYCQYDKAVPLWEEILAKNREHETSEYSANLLLHYYNQMEDFDSLLGVARDLEKDKAYLGKKPALKERVGSIMAIGERKRCEQLEKSAKESKDQLTYVECGECYAGIYNRDTEAEGTDELLFNAAVCYEDGKSVRQALGMYDILEKHYPNSKHTARAIGRMGEAYANVAFYKEAAEYKERYAAKYAGEGNAKSFLGDAVFYRKGLGDDDQAIKNTEAFIKHRDAKPDEKAEAFFGIHAIYEKQDKPDMVVKHLRDYIAKYGAKGGADRLVIAYTKIGKILWEQSCPVKMINGACVKEERARALSSKKGRRKTLANQTRCDDSGVVTTVVKRDAGKVRDAMAAFGKAVAAFNKASDAQGGDGARRHYATARFHLLEPEFESYLSQEFPENLRFDKPAEATKSKKRFDDWFTKKSKSIAALKDKYMAIDDTKEPSNMIAARARIGQMSQNLTNAMYTAEIPAEQRRFDEARDAYCMFLADAVEPVVSLTTAAYDTCLAQSTKLGWFSEWSRLCEYELGQSNPVKYPTAAELRSEPDRSKSLTDVEGPVLRVQ